MNDLQPSRAAHEAARVTVDLEGASYDIHIGEGLIDAAGELIAPVLARPFTAIVTDENVGRLHLERLQASMQNAGIQTKAIIVPAGEASKSYAQLAGLCDQLLAAGIERADKIVAFGGGVVGDLAGFAAAILRRGVDFVQIPTSLLAQVDSSVGGKTGINSPLGKNLIGAFHQPVMVIADASLLDTLPTRELAAGYAEVAKYGLLGDAELFTWLEDNAQQLFAGSMQARMKAIEASCQAKASIVSKDEREAGVRALLNLGHTFGHALEAATGYSQRLLHGEGVAIGMAMAFRFSEQLGYCPSGTAERVNKHLASVELPVDPTDISGDLPGADALLEIMHQDKKAQSGKLTFILTRDIGDAFIAPDVDKDKVLEFLQAELKQR
ncbi:MAG: 3-dehydroquinate synthase [Rhizobiales bacterium]|nr:3-dehydroquinate synthase [Hyphomicrobiales bacterium]